jgi:MYXO-CTERM domain-containing protein
MKPSSAVVVGFLFSTFPGACSSPPAIGERTQSIINGTTDSGDPAVVMVLSQVPGSMYASLCTGEVVSPHVVLTAAHCVDPAVVGTGAKSVVFTGLTLSTTSPMSEFLGVAEVHYDTAFSKDAPEAGHDIGVVILKAATTIAPVLYNRRPVTSAMVGQAARLVGYGITDPGDTMGTTAGTRRQAPTKLVNYSGIMTEFQDDQHTICEGDSGGPAFMMIEGEERIVGVTSYGYRQCPMTMPGVDTRVDHYLDFIDKWVTQLDPPPKGAGDSCSSDAECYPRLCTSTSMGKVCEQSCDPSASTSSCPDGTQCASVDGQNLCTQGSHGCDLGGRGPSGAWALALVFLALALRRRRRAI